EEKTGFIFGQIHGAVIRLVELSNIRVHVGVALPTGDKGFSGHTFVIGWPESTKEVMAQVVPCQSAKRVVLRGKPRTRSVSQDCRGKTSPLHLIAHHYHLKPVFDSINKVFDGVPVTPSTERRWQW
ncbi:MAG: hypothetical protein AAF614_33530, partial [Chloroflexota bacterium]